MVESHVRTRPVMWETCALMALCLVDIFATLLVVLTGRAIEVNPMLATALSFGPMAFVIVKLAWTVPGVIAVELIRWTRPRFARGVARFGVIGYLAVYILGSIAIH